MLIITLLYYSGCDLFFLLFSLKITTIKNTRLKESVIRILTILLLTLKNVKNVRLRNMKLKKDIFTII